MTMIEHGIATINIIGKHSRFPPGSIITRSDIDEALFDSFVWRGVIVPSDQGTKPEKPVTTLPRKRK